VYCALAVACGGDDHAIVERVPAFIDVASESGIDDFGTFPVSPAAAADRFAAGVCVLDVDHNPPYDLFFARRPTGAVHGAPGSRLYVAAGPLEYRDETAARGLSDVGDATACLAFDADGDDDDDLLVPGHGSLRFLRNDAGAFSDRSADLDVVVGDRTGIKARPQGTSTAMAISTSSLRATCVLHQSDETWMRAEAPGSGQVMWGIGAASASAATTAATGSRCCVYGTSRSNVVGVGGA